MDDLKKKPDRKEKHLEIEADDWVEAIGRAIKKPKPAEGWPKSEEDEKPKQDAGQ
jgi:hypothetical protein